MDVSSSGSRGWSSWMIEQAKEELEILETLYPNRYEYLKLELKSFITSSCNVAEEEHNNGTQQQQLRLFISSNSSSISVSTQASSSRKRKSSAATVGALQKCRKGNVDVAMERAQACLQKIREVKRSFI